MGRQTLEAMVLVGGKGTRLRTVVSDRPKPMALVCGRPFVEWLLLLLRKQDIRRMVLCTGYMSHKVNAYFGDGSRWGMELCYSRDATPLGTAGAVRQALDCVREDCFLVLNGDSYCRVDCRLLLEAHRRHRSLATIWLVPMADCARYGSVDLRPDGSVGAFLEKTNHQRPGLINAGVYLLERQVVEAIPLGRAVSLEAEIFPQLVDGGLHGVVGQGPFLDIGTPEAYAVAGDFFRFESGGMVPQKCGR